MRPHGQSPEERLREALLARADEVETSPDALPRIRMRTAGSQRRRGAWSMIGAAAAVAAAIAAVAVVVADRRPEHGQGPLPGASGSAVVSPPAPQPSAPGPSLSTPAGVNLPVYFVRNGKLYREFHPTRLTQDDDRARIAAAVTDSLRGAAADPDYRTLWPGGAALRGVSVDGHTVTVDLTGVGAGPVGGTADLAVQQLVYTVSAVSTYTSIKNSDGVRVLVDGAPVARLWGSTDIAGVLHQAPLVDVQAPVWVIDPEQSQQVGRSFTAYVAGIVPEGTVNLRVRDTGGQVVDERVLQLSAGAPALGEVRVPLTLPTGRYTIEAFYVSLKDSSIQWVDDHEFWVG
jgi:hypothetical protein